VETHDAIDLIRDAVGDGGGTWADLGAGTGIFTRALASLLGAENTVYAVDNDAGAVDALRKLSTRTSGARVVPLIADFTRPIDLPGLGDAPLDGILIANALHFVRDASGALTRLVSRLRSGGRAIVVEYDRRETGRWVPYPIPAARWAALATSSGLVGAHITARRPSMYAGDLYVGVATKP